MERNALGLLFLLFAVLTVTGCGEPVAGVAGAGQDVRRGNFQQALAVYLQAAEKTRHRRVVEYNLGNVYYYLGETDRAFEMWKKAAAASRPEAAYRAHFNRGVGFYGLQEYEKASNSFLQALRIYPDRREARINLEYCIRQLQAEIPEVVSGSGEKDEKDKRAVEILINILRQEEKTRWEKKPFTETEEAAPRDW